MACRFVLGGGSVDLAGVRELEFVIGPIDIAGATQVAYDLSTASGQDLKIGVMVAGNSGRPGGAIYHAWKSSPQQRLEGVHPGHRGQEENVVAAWLVGTERAVPHQLTSEWSHFRRQISEQMEARFVHCLHHHSAPSSPSPLHLFRTAEEGN